MVVSPKHKILEITKAFACFLSVCMALRLLVPDMGLEWAPVCAICLLPAMLPSDGHLR
jgi:hypothetical protein